VDAAHALLQVVRVPRDVVIEQDVAALEIDASPAASVAASTCVLSSQKFRSDQRREPSSSRVPGFMSP